jgi:DNA-binding CsgD family transcriptional regulator
MKQRRRIYYSAAQRSEIWDRWQAGEPMSSIGRRFDRESSSVFSVISPTGGIRPPDRHRAKQALSLSEREEISRWLSMRCSLRSIALHLGRSASTISREVQRNGGSDRYRAARSDQAAWDRARRPKLCKLACRPFLRRTVSTWLRRYRIEVSSLHAQDTLVPLRGDLHVRDVRYEIIKGTDFDGHNVPSDEQGVRDKDHQGERSGLSKVA